MTVSSGVFNTVTLNEGHSATATVDTTAQRGAQYTVTFTCSGETGTTQLMIAAAPTTPTGTVTAGTGSTMAGGNAAETAAGAALIAAAGLGALSLRRRSRRSGV